MYKSGVCDTNQRYLWNEAVYKPNLLQTVYKKLVYGLSISDKSGDLAWTLAYLAHFLERNEIWPR